MAGSQSQMPRARKEGLEVQDLGDEVLVYDRKRHRAHCLNPAAALVWRHCDGRTGVAKVAGMLADGYGLPPKPETVGYAVGRLRKAHLLEEASAPIPGGATSRRDLLKKLGLAATAMLPAVTSLVAPSPAHAMSCLPATGCVAGVNDCAPCENTGGNCNPAFRCCGGNCLPPGLALGQCGC